jgi:hypothetical protein
MLKVRREKIPNQINIESNQEIPMKRVHLNSSKTELPLINVQHENGCRNRQNWNNKKMSEIFFFILKAYSRLEVFKSHLDKKK